MMLLAATVCIRRRNFSLMLLAFIQGQSILSILLISAVAQAHGCYGIMFQHDTHITPTWITQVLCMNQGVTYFEAGSFRFAFRLWLGNGSLIEIPIRARLLPLTCIWRTSSILVTLLSARLQNEIDLANEASGSLLWQLSNFLHFGFYATIFSRVLACTEYQGPLVRRYCNLSWSSSAPPERKELQLLTRHSIS